MPQPKWNPASSSVCDSQSAAPTIRQSLPGQPSLPAHFNHTDRIHTETSGISKSFLPLCVKMVLYSKKVSVRPHRALCVNSSQEAQQIGAQPCWHHSSLCKGMLSLLHNLHCFWYKLWFLPQELGWSPSTTALPPPHSHPGFLITPWEEKLNFLVPSGQWNHRIPEGRRDFWRCPSPTPRPWQGHLEQERVQWVWDFPRGEDSTIPMAAVPGLCPLHGKKFLLVLRWNSLVFSLWPLLLILVLGTTDRAWHHHDTPGDTGMEHEISSRFSRL